MKTRRSSVWVLAMVASLLLGCVPAAERGKSALDAGAVGALSTQATASTTTEAGREAGDTAAGDGGEATESSDDVLDVPRIHSARPSEHEWATVDPTALGSDCDLTLFREWARVRCGTIDEEAGSESALYGSVVLLAGPRADVTANVESIPSSNFAPQSRATLVMALRPGDRRLFQLNTLTAPMGGYDPTPQVQMPGVTLSETWLAEARGPTLVLASAP